MLSYILGSSDEVRNDRDDGGAPWTGTLLAAGAGAAAGLLSSSGDFGAQLLQSLWSSGLGEDCHAMCLFAGPATETVPELGYWNIRGLGHLPRLLMTYAGKEFTDARYNLLKKADGSWDRKEWTSVKHTLGLDFPNLPYIKDGEYSVTEHLSILQYIAEKHCPDLAGKTAEEKGKVSMLLSLMAGTRDTFVKIAYATKKEDLAANIKTWEAGHGTNFAKSMSAFLGDREWLVGGRLSLADFYLGDVLRHISVFAPDLFQGDLFKTLRGFLDRFEKVPAVKSYLSSDKCPRDFNNKSAIWGVYE